MSKATVIFFRQLIPFFVSLAALGVAMFSAVSVDLVVVEGDLADVVLYAYAALMVAIVIRPDVELLHRLGVSAALGIWGGRALGFVHLALERRSWSLTGAVLERLALCVAVVVWHWASVHRIEGRRRT